MERVSIGVCALLLCFVATPVSAHTSGTLGGFLGGFVHPLLGLDHVLAMIAVGLWGAILGVPAIYTLPVVFPLVMALGGLLAIVGLPLPGAEVLIAMSAVLLGMSVALAARPPLWIAAVLVGAFAIAHGHAHGTERPPGADIAAYSLGFVMATGLIHLAGIALGLLARWRTGKQVVRLAGWGIACAGVYFLSRLT
jgi:urease accessory protein